MFNALRFGASGYLLKGVSVADLTNAVREVVRGGSIIAPDVASKALQMFARMAKATSPSEARTKKPRHESGRLKNLVSVRCDLTITAAIRVKHWPDWKT